MTDLIEKILLTGAGTLVLTQKKSEELLKELKERLSLTEDEGKDFLNKLQHSAKENQQQLEDLAREEILKAAERLGFVSRAEFDALNNRLTKLEQLCAAKP